MNDFRKNLLYIQAHTVRRIKGFSDPPGILMAESGCIDFFSVFFLISSEFIGERKLYPATVRPDQHIQILTASSYM